MMVSTQKAGIFYALSAYGLWGLFPIFWKQLDHVSHLEILCHRMLWAFLFYTVVVAVRRGVYRPYIPKNKKELKQLSFAAALILTNWFTYIYGVNSGHIVETSLGYFINPLMSVLVGVIVLKEKLEILQKFAFVLALIGVTIIALQQSGLPWIALILAVSFSFYGLIKKTNKVPGLLSNQYESGLMVPLALVFLGTRLFLIPGEVGSFEYDGQTWLLLLAAGPATGLPLIFFAEAAQRLPMYLLGFFQFLAPSMQFLSGIFIFGEEISSLELYGFVFIWSASILVVLSSVRKTKGALSDLNNTQLRTGQGNPGALRCSER